MKIGIGCLTYNRPDHLRWWVKQVKEHTPDNGVTVHIANDNKERKGVAFRSTECIRELYNAGCKYFFLFNDDCAPIKDGWAEYFISASNESGNNHFIYQHETPSVNLVKSENGINSFDNCNGAMLFFTREVVDKVGGFNPDFGIYGYDHAEYSNRIFSTGLNPMGKYLCPDKASDYIYSLDIDHHKPEWHKQLKHKSSMSPAEALYHVQKSKPVFERVSKLKQPL
jgi:GT2 family glycosyltransferase